MPAHSKNLNHRTSLRYNDQEDAIIRKVVQAHADVGITISANDAVRICIRRAAAPLPADERSARTAIERHLRDCEHCTPKEIKCPDGWALNDAYGRVTAPRPTKAPILPPAAPEEPQGPSQRPTVRRAPAGRHLAGRNLTLKDVAP